MAKRVEVITQPSPPASGLTTPSWRLIILLGALTAFAPLSIDLYLPALPTIARSFSASPEAIHSTLATFLVGMATGQLIYGPLSDRIGRRSPILIGLTLYVVASIICALAPTIGVMTAARFFQALGGCAGSVIARVVIRDRFDHRETARILSLLTLVMGLAPVVAPLLGSWVLLVGPWRTIFWGLAAFGLSIGIWSYRSLAESRSAETAAQARNEHPLRTFAILLRNPRLCAYVVAGALNSAVLFTYVSSSSSLVIDTYGFSPQFFAAIFALNAVGIVGAAQVNRRLLKRHMPDRVLGWASMASLAIGSMLVLSAWFGLGGYGTILPLLFAAMATFGLMAGNTTAGALSVDPKRAGSISSILGSASYTIGAIASSIAGIFHDATARPLATIMFCCLIGSATAIFFAVSRRGDNKHSQLGFPRRP